MDGDARVAVLESELRRAQEDIAELKELVAALQEGQARMKTNFEVLKTRVGMYAAVGAAIGGALLGQIKDMLAAGLHLP